VTGGAAPGDRAEAETAAGVAEVEREEDVGVEREVVEAAVRALVEAAETALAAAAQRAVAAAVGPAEV
jgi:Arc/MetJ family transcription regulator